MILLCGQEVGCKALDFFTPKAAVCYDEITREKAGILKTPYVCTKFYPQLIPVNVLLSVHGREIIKKETLEQIPCYNIHPYLYCYKGADPIGRAIKAKNTWASVGLHKMSEEADVGEVIFEVFAKIEFTDSYEVFYSRLYPLYHACFHKFKEILNA